MTDPAASPDLPPLAEPPPPPRKKGRPLVAWVVIVAVAVFLLWRSTVAQQAGEGRDERVSSIVLRLQGRYVVGAAGLVPAGDRKMLYGQLGPLNTGPAGQRLRFAVLAGELQGPDEALKQLHDLRDELDRGTVKGDPEDIALVGVLERLYGDYKDGHLDAPSVTAEERERLRQRLGWFGDLALAPQGGPKEAREAALAPARRTAVIMISALSAGATVGLFGFAALVPFLVLLLAGRLRSGLPGPDLYGGVYAEAFAVWLVLFIGLSVAAARVELPVGDMLVHAAVDFISLAGALAWPLLRGVPWGQLRRDAGLTLGRRPALEPFLGLACYAMAIPLLVVGALLTLALIRLQSHLPGHAGEAGAVPNTPVHPIVHSIGGADWQMLVQLLLLASVAAPIVEETMFRGLLYRQLRESTGRWGRAGSVLASAGLVSFVFAAIHPQGWTAIPALMALALAFNFMREWRGTLIPCMIAHGINNGLVIVALHFALGS